MKKYVLIVLAMLLGGCSRNAAKSLNEEYSEALLPDTAVCPAENLSKGTFLDNALDYFKKNNRFANWDKNNKKVVVIRCIVEKNGTASHITIRRGSGIKKLDAEAVRLIQNAKMLPGEDNNGNLVRAKWTGFVDFPAK